MSKTPRFTLVFEGDLREKAPNPFQTETPYGTAFAASCGDALDKIDALEAENLRLRGALEDGSDLGLAPDECREALSRCPAGL